MERVGNLRVWRKQAWVRLQRIRHLPKELSFICQISPRLLGGPKGIQKLAHGRSLVWLKGEHSGAPYRGNEVAALWLDSHVGSG